MPVTYQLNKPYIILRWTLNVNPLFINRPETIISVHDQRRLVRLGLGSEMTDVGATPQSRFKM